MRPIHAAFFDRSLVAIFKHEWYAQLIDSVLKNEIKAHCYKELHIQGASI